MRKAVALLLLGLSAAGCTMAPPPGGGGVVTPPPGGGGGSTTPPPPRRALLPASLSTADNDAIRVAGQPGNGSGQVRLCLTTRRSMWKKELAISGGTTLRSENGTTDCAAVDPAPIRFEMRKAKALGVMTGVGYGSMNLTGWGGGTVRVTWTRD